MKPLAKVIGLVRGINVGGHNVIPMAELRSLCTSIGWQDVQTYIQSGNLVFSAAGTPAAAEATLEHAIHKRFGFSVIVVVRTASDWAKYIKSNPFPETTGKEPNRVLLALAKKQVHPGAAEALLAKATFGERIVQGKDALWIHFCGGVGKSKLSPALLDRLVGSSVTARNWNTVIKLEQMVNGAGGRG